MYKYLIGLDLGSSGMKGVVLQEGQIAAQGSEPMPYLHESDVCEYDAEVYYNTAAGLIQSLVRGVSGQCAGLAVACASGNSLLLKEGRPLAPVISWRDERGGPELEETLPFISEETLHRLCGWHRTPKFPLAQLSWLAKHKPELLEEADMICEGSCYLNYRLCGKLVMDHSTATTFYLQNQSSLQWESRLFTPLRIRLEQLPPLVPSGSCLGNVTERAAAETGLSPGVPVAAGCYDGASVARAAGVFHEGQLLLSCGTSWVCGYPCKSREQLLQMGTMIDPYLLERELWLGMTSLGEAGVYVDRALDRFLPKGEGRIKWFNQLAARSPAGAKGLLINPMRLEECGDLSSYSPAEVCRAVMEGIVYSVKRQILAVQQACPAYPEVREVIMAGGPACSPLWPQIVSDILELPVRVPHSSSTSAVGAAVLAGLGSGIFGSAEEAFTLIQTQKDCFLPNMAHTALYRWEFSRFREAFPGRDVNMI